MFHNRHFEVANLDTVKCLEYNRVERSVTMLLLISSIYSVRCECLKTGNESMYPPETNDLLVKMTKVMSARARSSAS